MNWQRGALAAVVWVTLAAAPSEGNERPLRAGAAVARFELDPGVALAGYGARGPGNESRGVHDPVEARALVVEGANGAPRIGIVAMDLLIISPRLRVAIEARTSALDLDALVVAATHTHSGPGSYAEGFATEASSLGWFDPAVLESLTDAGVVSLERAARALAPARIGAAMASLSGVGHNRRREGGPESARVAVVRVDGESGRSIATLFTAAAHPTVLPPSNDLLSADYPGIARRDVERERGGVAIFLAGPLGDQGPGIDPAIDDPFDQAADLGARLASAVVEAAAHATPAADAEVDFATAFWELPPVDVRGACVGYVLAPLLHWVARTTFSTHAPITALRLGALRVLAAPLEPGVEIAAALRARAPGLLAVAAHSGDWLGYLLLPDDYGRGGYETCLAFHGPGLAPAFLDASVEVLDALETD